MAPRPPHGGAGVPDPLEAEVAAEKAAALGEAGRRMVKALAALDAGCAGSEERERLLADAAERVWGYLIQREIVGLRDPAPVIAHYAIPPEVLNRLGAVRVR